MIMRAPNDSLECVARMREVAERLRDGAAGDAGAWLAKAVEAYLNGARDGLTLEQALGVKVDAGGSPWWIEEAREDRDRVLREYARRFCPAEGAVAALGSDLTRYARARWKRDRRLKEMPVAYRATQFELLYRAFRANESVAPGRMPASDRQLRGILASHCAIKQKLGGETPPFHRREVVATSASKRS